MPAKFDDGDVAYGCGREEQLAWAGVGGFGHVAADEGFFEGEFHHAFEGYGGGHGDHGAWVLLVNHSAVRAFIVLWVRRCSDKEENVPGFAVNGHPIANCTVNMVFVSRWLTR